MLCLGYIYWYAFLNHKLFHRKHYIQTSKVLCFKPKVQCVYNVSTLGMTCGMTTNATMVYMVYSNMYIADG